MGVQLTISYETLLALVEQLPPDQKSDLALRLTQYQLSLKAMPSPETLTTEEKIAILKSMAINSPIKEEPSIRREDWYDDGR